MGSGLSLDLIPADISRIHALDQSAEMVARTRIKYKHVETITGSALNTPYESGCMDLILCIGVSEYIADIDVLISEIFRVLDDKGSVINDKVYSRPATVIIPVLISLSFL